ncbi:uncharacterized protein LOC132707700 [Cylas formicarius]|uniref:uncharacterized protein LOC132707700 n=1 Tax=Cylas formicarius TaxID=197179 RepID=UPI002958A61B|nr:uncharacterized protein LOC132707700 [Cylas formicarius]
MFKLVAFFAILAAAFAAPTPAPKPGLAPAYSLGLPLAYSAINQPIAYSNLGYSNLGYAYAPYASSYYYNSAPLTYII